MHTYEVYVLPTAKKSKSNFTLTANENLSFRKGDLIEDINSIFYKIHYMSYNTINPTNTAGTFDAKIFVVKVGTIDQLTIT